MAPSLVYHGLIRALLSLALNIMSIQLPLVAGKDQLTPGKSGMHFIYFFLLLLLLFTLCLFIKHYHYFWCGEFNFVCLCVLICLAFSVFVLFIYLFFNFCCCRCCCFYVLFCFCFSIFGLSCSPLRHFHQSFISFSLKQLPVINTVSTFWQVTLVC